jgi:4-hydroxyphenylpyruvate dioxygenase
LTDYQVLLDFGGAPDAIREAKRAEALRMLDTAAAVGANTLLTPACTRKDCVADRIEEDLRWLAREAAQRGLRVAYEGMAWSTINRYTPDAWQTLKNVGEKNLGMVIDAFHIFVRTAADFEGIPAERIFLVQLSDLDHDLTRDTVVDTARHHRLLPGQGTFPLDTILQALRAKSYAGPIGLQVFNNDLKAQGSNQPLVLP